MAPQKKDDSFASPTVSGKNESFTFNLKWNYTDIEMSGHNLYSTFAALSSPLASAKKKEVIFDAVANSRYSEFDNEASNQAEDDMKPEDANSDNEGKHLQHTKRHINIRNGHDCVYRWNQ